MVYLEALGVKLLVVSDHKHAEELLEKRAINYSDRPIVPMVEMYVLTCSHLNSIYRTLTIFETHVRMKIHWSFAFMQYAVDWRQHRRAFHQYLNKDAVKAFHPVMLEEVETLLKSLSREPKSFARHIQLFVFRTINKLVL